MRKTEIVALSYGGGIQTTAMALMLAAGELTPMPDLAIFADTGAEPAHVYDTVDWIRPRLPFPLIITAAKGNLESDTLDLLAGRPTWNHPKPTPVTDLPVFSATHKAITKRQCTDRYKIRPIKAAIVAWAGIPPRQLAVTQLMGISIDEAGRMKPARDSYITNAYPLVDALLSRADCVSYLNDNHPGHPAGRSACYFCPFHSAGEWRELMRRYPVLWEKAKDIDARLRRPPRQLSLFPYGQSAEAIELQSGFGEGWLNECEGHCGV